MQQILLCLLLFNIKMYPKENDYYCYVAHNLIITIFYAILIKKIKN
jgi:hypothetical protein